MVIDLVEVKIIIATKGYDKAYFFAKRCKPWLHGVASYFIPVVLAKALKKWLGETRPLMTAAQHFWKTENAHNLNFTADTCRFEALRDVGLARVDKLPEETITRLNELMEGPGHYTLLGKSAPSRDDAVFGGVLPDYKFVYLGYEDLPADTWQTIIPDDTLHLVSKVAGMKMKISWAMLYRTYARKLNQLPNGGRYVSFDWHFDNSGVPTTFKLMHLLTPVQKAEDGAFELQSGRRYRTLLPGLGNSRLTFLNPAEERITRFTGDVGDGALFDVNCAHRGGLTQTTDRDVMMVEFVPSGNGSSTIWADD